MNVDTDQFTALAAEVDRIGRAVNVLIVRVEETLAAAFPSGPLAAARRAPARRARRRSDRPGHLRPVDGGKP